MPPVLLTKIPNLTGEFHMALQVYQVNQKTRLVMPSSLWAHAVLEKLKAQGHQVELTDQDPHEVQHSRSVAEREAAMALIDGTGH